MPLTKIILFFTLLFISFNGFSQAVTKKSVQQLIKEGYVKGVVRNKTGLDGCGYLIELTNKENLQVGKLDSAFMRKNLKVWIKYEVPKKPVMSTCMAGKVVTLKDIRRRK